MIKSLTIGHVRSFYDEVSIDFVSPALGKYGLNILVGENNAGKSTILKYMTDYFRKNRNDIVFDKLDRHDGTDPNLEIFVQGDDELIRFFIEKYSSSSFVKKCSGCFRNKKVDFIEATAQHNQLISYVPARRPWTDMYQSQSRQTRVNFHTFESSGDVFEDFKNNQFRVPNLGDYLNGVLHDGDKPEFDKLLNAVFPEIFDWSTDRIGGADRITYKVENTVEHPLGQTGDGILSVFRICFALFSAVEGVPIIIDEPELSLHPQAQKRLFKLICREAARRQIIIATHSPHFVDWDVLSKGAKIFRVEKAKTGASNVYSPDPNTVEKICDCAVKDKRNRKLFDYLAKELVFQSSAVFVEGQEDVHIISLYLESKQQEPLPLFSYGAGGAANIQHWLKFCDELNILAVGLFDFDRKVDFERCKKEFAKSENIEVILAGKEDIRDKVDDSGKLQKEGYFDENWDIKPECQKEFDALIDKISSALDVKAA